MKKSVVSLTAGMTLLLTLPVSAEDKHRQLGAHMHGLGSLNLVIEGKKIAMELVVPGMDIVGFENKATTDEQKSQVKTAIKILEKEPVKLFALSVEATCTFSKAHAELTGDSHEDHHEHDHDKDHDHDKHAKHNAGKKTHDHHEEHDHKKDEAHEEGASHNEFRATYEIECKAPKSLKKIDFPFFKRFPRSQELAVTIVNKNGAKSHKATRDKPQVKLEM